jgi:hypothetical protein
VLLLVDEPAAGELKRSSFEELAAQTTSPDARRLIESLAATHDLPAGEFLLPVVVSMAGIERDRYSTAFVAESLSAGDGTLTLALFGDDGAAHGKVDFLLAPRERIRLYDAMVELSGEQGSGWLRARSTVPLRLNAALVNRGRSVVSETPPLLPRCGTKTIDVDARDSRELKLWLLNAASNYSATRIRIDAGGTFAEKNLLLPPHAVNSFVNPSKELGLAPCFGCRLRFTIAAGDGSCVVETFLSEKNHATGGTTFHWSNLP